MRTLYFSLLGTALAVAATPASASEASMSALPMMGKAAASSNVMRHALPGGVQTRAATAHRWGSRIQGRWYGGMRAPGGWAAYRRPVYGWTLPGYWINPGFYIGNYSAYGLPAPRTGYGWSRYYDDAVLTDSAGRVYDSRSGIAWDNYEGGYGEDWSDAAPPPASVKRDTGIGGALMGGAVGAVAGNIIAGKGNRTVGTLVGAGVGAVAGAAIDKAEDKGRRAPPASPHASSPPSGNRYASGGYDMDHGDDGVTYDGPPSRDRPGVGYDAPPAGPHAHWRGADPMISGNGRIVNSYTQPGYFAGGYYYPGPTVTTVVIQPVVTTTVETTYVTRRVATRKAWKPKAHCRCK